jgi:hypothetical protein
MSEVSTHIPILPYIKAVKFELREWEETLTLEQLQLHTFKINFLKNLTKVHSKTIYHLVKKRMYLNLRLRLNSGVFKIKNMLVYQRNWITQK